MKYKVVTLKDGRTDAPKPRYVPKAKTISSDPKDGSGRVVSVQSVESGGSVAYVESNLLYSYPVMLGMTGDMTGANFDQYEAARGICPEGWHIRRWPNGSNWRVSAAATSPIRRRPGFEQTQSGGSIVMLNKDDLTSQAAVVISMRWALRRPGYMYTVSLLMLLLLRSAWVFPKPPTGYKVTTIRPV